MKTFFIMLYNQRGDYADPIVNSDGEVVFWSTKNEAENAMRGHIYADDFGYEVHELGGCAL